MSSTSQPTSKERLYFGYGSNLWRWQMTQRCPDSPFLGIARLDGYKWIINSRGYANVVPCKTTTSTTNKNLTQDDSVYDTQVWGAVYDLSAADEAQLDINEGVPVAYTKEDMSVSFWREPATIKQQPETRDMLVYIDHTCTKDDQPRAEYVVRMNRGIADAVKAGVPEGYVRRVLRKFIPEQEDDGVGKLAEKQARLFEDE